MLPWVDDVQPVFPDVESALTQPDGLLAVSQKVTWRHLLSAYPRGIFPWYNLPDPVLWWSPDPRLVLFPNQLHISRSLRKTLRTSTLRVSFDCAFADVMQACAQPRRDTHETWINRDIIRAYCDLHQRGFAHSVEVWRDNELVGGLYGVALGRIFFGESMFSRVDNASKIGFVNLVKLLQELGFECIDCQVSSEHLINLGAINISRRDFTQLLSTHIDTDTIAQQLAVSTPANWSRLKRELGQ